MANWCMNRVEFDSDEIQMETLEKFFTEMAKKELETKQGQLPAFAAQQSGYMFDVEFEHGMLFYQTKWSPNTEVILGIAKHFNVDFKHNYEEYGNQIFGEAVYEDGELSIIELDNFDLDTFEFDQSTESYIFEGSHFELIDQIVETLIYRKKHAQNSPN